MKSTMGAPFTEAETRRVLNAWEALRAHASIRPPAEPVAMLDWITETIGHCYEVRRAISDGFYYSNKRAFPAPAPRQSRSTNNLTKALALLTEDEIAAVLEKFQKASTKP